LEKARPKRRHVILAQASRAFSTNNPTAGTGPITCSSASDAQSEETLIFSSYSLHLHGTHRNMRYYLSLACRGIEPTSVEKGDTNRHFIGNIRRRQRAAET